MKYLFNRSLIFSSVKVKIDRKFAGSFNTRFVFNDEPGIIRGIWIYHPYESHLMQLINNLLLFSVFNADNITILGNSFEDGNPGIKYFSFIKWKEWTVQRHDLVNGICRI